MRKFLCFLLCLIFICSMAACSPSNSTPSPTTPGLTEPPSTSGGIEDAPMHVLYAVSVPSEVETIQSDNDVTVFEYAYQHIQVQLPDQNISDKITLDFLNRVDKSRINAELLAQQAKDAYNGSSNWSPYKYQIYYSPMRVDFGIISLFGTRTTYSGGLHPELSGISVNYDAANGEALTLGSILNHVDNKQDLCALVLAELEGLAYQYSLFDGYENVVTERFLADESTDEAFYFTDSGLCFFFDPYELAPFSTGVISVEIPYDKLPGILGDAYFPDEYLPSTGTLMAESAENQDISAFTQIIEANLYPNGERVLLYSDKTVQRLTITHGTWTPDGLYFVDEYVVFRATGVSADKALIVRMPVYEMLPELKVTYETVDGVHSFYISKSSENGTITLLPAE